MRDALDLGEESLDESKVAARNAVFHASSFMSDSTIDLSAGNIQKLVLYSIQSQDMYVFTGTFLREDGET
jgi:hypothetical protein